ncbi:hypothetical protein ACMGDH_13415 [Sphingomonas sp. DT-207]|uniref:hypothetical protein n=1 Tax=Sphingomonas sp. DT-207 TaxID=3396167 RepID=UPI003F1D23D6
MAEDESKLAPPPEAAAFFDAISAFEPHMKPTLSYLAFRRDESWHLFRGRINYNFSGVGVKPFQVRTDNIIAGAELLAGGPSEARQRVQDVLSGALVAGGERLLFPQQFGGGYAASYLPLHPDGVERQIRVSLLQIRGSDQYGYHSHTPFDWELRATEQPFDGMADLLGTLGIPTLPDPASLFEIMAFEVAAIDAASAVEGEKARFGISLAPGLDHAKASLGYRILSAGKVIARGRIPGNDLHWTSDTAREVGYTELDVPAAAVMQAFASYSGTTYHHWWFHDPSHSQNPRRAAFELSDPGLQTLQSFLENSGKQARDLEFSVSWLLWILGFSPAHLGANARMSEAPDLLVTTPRGHFAVIECTTGVLKAEHKLALLVQRSEAVRKGLQLSNNQHLRVLPVMVTTKTREEVRGELEDARKSGVVVVTRDDLPPLISRTLLLTDPDQLYTEAEETLREPPSLDPDAPELALRT